MTTAENPAETVIQHLARFRCVPVDPEAEARKLLRRIVVKWLIQAHQGHADGLTGAQPSADTPDVSQALTAPHSDSLDRDRAADIYDPNKEQ